MAESAALLVEEVFPREPMRQWVLSFPFQLRFLFASYPELMSKVLGIVYRTLSTHLIKKAGYSKATVRTGAVTLIQRFGSALNLNVHFHMLFLDGVYAQSTRCARGAGSADDAWGKLRFHRVKAPTQEELLQLTHTLSHRVARFLERRGLLERDVENSYLVFEQQEEDAMQQLFGHSITYRIAIGPHQGRKVFTLQTLPPLAESSEAGQAATWLEKTLQERHRAMTWMQRLKRVFNIDIEICERCGGKVKVIAEMSDHSIEDPVVIAHILKQLKQTDALTANAQPYALPQERSPPQSQLFDKPY